MPHAVEARLPGDGLPDGFHALLDDAGDAAVGAAFVRADLSEAGAGDAAA